MTRVRFQYSSSQEGLLLVLRFSSHSKNQHFEIPIRSGRLTIKHEPLARETGRPLPTPTLNKELVIFIINQDLSVTGRFKTKCTPPLFHTRIYNPLEVNLFFMGKTNCTIKAIRNLLTKTAIQQNRECDLHNKIIVVF